MTPIAENLYITVYNNSFYIIDGQRNILFEREDGVCCYKQNLSKLKGYGNGETCVWYLNMYNSVICDGSLYIQVFEKVYKLERSGFKYLTTIPDLNVSHSVYFYGKLF